MKKKKAKGVSWYKKEAWKYLSRLTRLKQPMCQGCRSAPSAHAHHIIPRARGNAVYLEPGNIIALCAGCHFKWHNSMSLNEMDVIVTREMGAAYQQVENIKNTHRKFSIPELKTMIKSFQDEINELENNSYGVSDF